MITPPRLTRTVLPVFILLGVGYAALRFLPSDALCNRALECAVTYREPTAPFRSNLNLHFAKVCGDLPRMSNELGSCVWREETFITDVHGFRNAEWSAENHPTLIFGDSFAFGQGSAQIDIPSEELTRTLGKPVYNGAGKTELRYLKAAMTHLPRLNEVLYLHLERHPRSPAELHDYDEGFGPRDLTWIRRLREQWKTYNPLQIIAGKIDRALIRNGVLPNRFGNAVQTLATATSGTHLFYPPTAHFVLADGERVKHEVEFFRGLQRRLHEKGIVLTVVLVPEKFTVYLGDPKHLDRFHLTALSHALASAEVPSVNLLPVFLAEVRLATEESEPLYWRDDTHWSPRGIRVMAREVKQATSSRRSP